MSGNRVEYEATADDSDKSFTTGGLVWEIQDIYINYTSTATAGNRQLVVEITDVNSNVVFRSKAGVVQAASLVYEYSFTPAVARESSVVALSLQVPIPIRLKVLADHTLRVYDSAAIAAAADDMLVAIRYKNINA